MTGEMKRDCLLFTRVFGQLSHIWHEPTAPDDEQIVWRETARTGGAVRGRFMLFLHGAIEYSLIEVARWLEAHEDEFADEEFEHALDYLVALTRDVQIKKFTFKFGRPPGSGDPLIFDENAASPVAMSADAAAHAFVTRWATYLAARSAGSAVPH